MIISKEFKVNDYILLCLDNDETFIYIGGSKFRQCKQLLLNISVDKIQSFDKIHSIDEIAEKLEDEGENESQERIIPPDIEFWGHSSNLQVWYENNYDTRLLHRSLAFPLLKRLTEVGDPVAKKVFKEEIVKRVNSGHQSVICFLKEEGYFDYLSHEEQLMALLHPKEMDALLEIEYYSNIKLEYTLDLDELLSHSGYSVENKGITELSLSNCKLKTLPDSIGNFPSLRVLNLERNQLTSLPDSIGNLSHLDTLCLSENQLIILSDSISNLTSLRKLVLNDNRLRLLPDSIGNLYSLKLLNLERNLLTTLPKSIKNLESLKFLDLEGNNLKNSDLSII